LRSCIRCGSTKTTKWRDGKYSGDCWYKYNEAFQCNNCYRKHVMPERYAWVNMWVKDKRKISKLRVGSDTTFDVLDRVVDYYINNRLDPITRKELLAKL
jgi:hypothetical protein